MKYLACIAEKFTGKQISPIVEIDAENIYDVANKLEEIFKVKVDGKNNYADMVLIEEYK